MAYKKSMKAAGNSPVALEDMIGRILAVALMGNAKGRHHLESMRSELTLDGHMAEIHSEAVRIYNNYARETGKLPLLK